MSEIKSQTIPSSQKKLNVNLPKAQSAVSSCVDLILIRGYSKERRVLGATADYFSEVSVDVAIRRDIATIKIFQKYPYYYRCSDRDLILGEALNNLSTPVHRHGFIKL